MASGLDAMTKRRAPKRLTAEQKRRRAAAILGWERKRERERIAAEKREKRNAQARRYRAEKKQRARNQYPAREYGKLSAKDLHTADKRELRNALRDFQKALGEEDRAGVNQAYERWRTIKDWMRGQLSKRGWADVMREVGQKLGLLPVGPLSVFSFRES